MTQTTQNPNPQTAKSSATRDQILSFIQRFAARHNYPPSVREIAEAVGLRSPATIHRHIGNPGSRRQAAPRQEPQAGAGGDRRRQCRPRAVARHCHLSSHSRDHRRNPNRLRHCQRRPRHSQRGLPTGQAVNRLGPAAHRIGPAASAVQPSWCPLWATSPPAKEP